MRWFLKVPKLNFTMGKPKNNSGKTGIFRKIKFLTQSIFSTSQKNIPNRR